MTKVVPIDNYQKDRSEVANELRHVADLVESGQGSAIYVLHSKERNTWGFWKEGDGDVYCLFYLIHEAKERFYNFIKQNSF